LVVDWMEVELQVSLQRKGWGLSRWNDWRNPTYVLTEDQVMAFWLKITM